MKAFWSKVGQGNSCLHKRERSGATIGVTPIHIAGCVITFRGLISKANAQINARIRVWAAALQLYRKYVMPHSIKLCENRGNLWAPHPAARSCKRESQSACSRPGLSAVCKSNKLWYLWRWKAGALCVPPRLQLHVESHCSALTSGQGLLQPRSSSALGLRGRVNLHNAKLTTMQLGTLMPSN